MTIKQVAKIIDHTNIDLKATAKDIKKTCQEAKKYAFRGVCVNPEWVKLVRKELKDTDIKRVVLLDPPMGQSSHSQRVKMSQKAKKDGVDELDIVMNIIDLKYGRYNKVLKDLKGVCKILPTKVIIGSGYLTDEEILKASQLVKKAGAECVKTATAKDPLERRELEEKAKHLKIMRKGAPGLLIKAAGKIKILEDLKKMVKAGADIIGTSSGVKIIKETMKKMKPEEFQPVIGLEIHVELNTKSKMFCSCPNDPDEQHPNVNICPICTAQPGSLPVINQEAIKKTIKTGLALNCRILEHSKFDRKNYFYPDLPKNYQISQLYMPFCKEGFLKIDNPEALRYGAGKKIKIREVHLEEDTGKLVHPEGADHSLVDFNRAGIPLMELVTEPDLRSAKEARRFAEELQLILRYLNVSAADMEKGQMRIEANISIGKGEKLGTKVEIKNLNSFRTVEKGIDYEIKRQTEVLGSGKKVIQETRGWDENKGITVSQRWKEEAHDYRYFPEPDLPPLKITKEYVQEIKAEIPELPQQRRERFKKEYNLLDKEIEIFVQNKDLGEYFEKVMSELRDWVKSIEIKSKISESEQNKLIKLCTNYILTDLQALLKKAFVSEEDFLITPENFAEFITLIYEGKISSKIGKMVLAEMFKTGADPSHIIEEKGLVQIVDTSEIDKLAKEIISKNPKPVKDYQKGKETALQFLIGQLMKESKGRVNPQMANEILKKLLKK